MLVCGAQGTGKTALVSKIALECGYPFVQKIHPDKLVGLSPFGKSDMMNKIFNDAYKSSLSVVILEDVERLIEYTHYGGRFTNSILQDLLVNLKRKPKEPERKIFIIGTSSVQDVMEDLEVASCFNQVVRLKKLTTDEEKHKVINEMTNPDEIEKKEFMIQVSDTCGDISIKHFIHTLERNL